MINGEIVFRIADEKEIDVRFSSGLKPTKIIKKGEIKKFGRESKNQWECIRSFNSYDGFDKAVNELLSELYAVKDEIHTYKQEYDYIGITVYLRSDYGQMGCIFNEDAISKISAIGSELSIDILSGGKV